MLHELFLFIGGYMCYASCVTKWMTSYAGLVPAEGIFAYIPSIGAAGKWISYGSVIKICTTLCTASDYFDSRDEDSE
jgi:hypothetical protein